jgi:hypothetical protein
MKTVNELSIQELEAEIARRKQEAAEKFALPPRLSSLLFQDTATDIMRWKSRAFDDIELRLEILVKNLIDNQIDGETMKEELIVSIVHTVYGERGIKFLDKLRKRYNG